MSVAQPGPPVAVSVSHPRLDSLTGLRWVAALVVFAFHLRNIGQIGGIAQKVLNHAFGAGATGVSLFFILSGFVLTWSHRPGTTVARFWRKRLARIYPLHIVGVALALVLGFTLIPRIAPTDPIPVIANLLLVSAWNPEWLQVGNPVSWTLVCEAFFYLAFPFLIAVVARLRSAAVAVLALASTAATIAIPLFTDQLPAIVAAHSSPLGRLPEFLLGICLAHLMRTGAWRGPSLTLGVFTALAGYAWANDDLTSPLSYSAYTVVGFALLTAALARADIAGHGGLLATRPLVTLGAVSYAFYLFHLLILEAWVSLWNAVGITHSWSTSALVATTAFLIALGVSWLAHRYIEQPGVRLLSPRRPAPMPVRERELAHTPA